jgi:lysozyme
VSEIGIDVSRYQNNIDWKKVVKDDDHVTFVFIKATQGTNYSKVSYFHENVSQASSVGLKVGAYHYYDSTLKPLDQAKYFYQEIKKEEPYLNYPLVLDLEENQLKLSKKQLTDDALTFLNFFKSKGYQILLYTGDYFLDSNLDEDRLKDYLFWVARYGKTPNNKADIHQFSDSGDIDGINGNVDMNITNLNLAFKSEKDYLVINKDLKFWQAKSLVSEYEKKGFKCQGSSIKPLGKGEQPTNDTPYQFTIFCTHSEAIQLVIELKIKGYGRTYGTEAKA